MSAYQIFNAFIDSERHKFETAHNNMFAFACSQVLRYYDFCSRILEHHHRTADEFVSLVEQRRKLTDLSQQSTGSAHEEYLKEYRQVSWKTHDRENELQLEIESFYIFAKVMLDRAAQAVRFYFGGHNAPSLESHHSLVDNLEEYCRTRGLQSEHALMSVARDLRSQISDIRDHQIVHEKNPRAARPLTWHSANNIQMHVTKLYPTAKDTYEKTTPLQELWPQIDAYLRCLVDFLSANSAKTNLKLKTS